MRILAMIAMLALPGPLLAAGADLPVIAPAMDCAALAQQNFSTLKAPTTITSATETQVDGHTMCVVEGVISPRVTFRVQMPVSGWTQRYLQTGCGGLCGRLGIESPQRDCPAIVNGEFAMASTDMGHDTSGGLWAASDMQLRVDFGYRGVHVTSVIAKRIITAYYGQAPQFSYFSGCSDGGREALMEAQRYPDDFDGIAAGAAALNFLVQNSMAHGWNAHVVQPLSDDARLTTDDLPVLHQAALDACDARDGTADGLISDPFGCDFDPLTLAGNGLSETAARAAADLYRGPYDGDQRLVVGALLPGSELNWAGVAVAGPPPGGLQQAQGDAPAMDQIVTSAPTSGRFAMSPQAASDMIPGMAYVTPFDPDWTLADFTFTTDQLEKMRPMHGIYDATNPDISAFADRGGKLIVWHGLADPHISAANSVAWVQAAQAVLGDKADGTLRLFLIPGMGHCSGGQDLTSIDVMSPLMDWVENGTAPDSLIASADDAAAQQGKGRTLFPFPATATLQDGGTADTPADWQPGTAMQVAPTLWQNWAGADYFRSGFQQDCGFEGLNFLCRPHRP
ncbi:MAG: tannase/feruloyl esterase family alpha/beta hydrolase [Paracoccus sp. (in: a-proteobacteria)]|uniref:tannase/feruloyl esterase family alpha/beta hydrolase n=1 Tax=Paracoccus sp. TaxID=267 RepID=UPI0026DFA7E1|nr:tannase/feruloyl esterase family alpha/beta hydrolase [Paracoccus sp. (in: a-proteobacteria)]MDO5632475.1 tannase/feruloyl esterase family alpha/beta hydrolase [Paracoccus sp. (in: a-proteobacteria)]